MLDPWYVSGFCDGEAAFTYSRSGGTIGLYFSIKQRGDNQQIIEEIRRYFNYVGNIYRSKEAPAGSRSLSQSATYFRVTRIEELKRIVEHFDKFPLQSKKKKEVYNVWRQMVIHKLENYRDVDFDKLRALAEKLSSLNLQSRAYKVHAR